MTLSAVGDNDLRAASAGFAADGLDLFDDVHAFDDRAENNVLTVEPRGLDGAQEELKTTYFAID